MAKILFKDWNNGLQKISLTKLLEQNANLNLKTAKSKIDDLLDGKTFILEIESIDKAEELMKEATAVGAVCEIIKEND